jgi:regulator of protease activity HflC (stomatin/prohibitin superfamily)
MRSQAFEPRISRVGVTLFIIAVAAGFVLTAATKNPIPFGAGIAIGLYCLFAIRVANQWEKVAVLRFGRYIGLRGPGLYHIVPIVDTISRYVDQRVRVANVSAESTLTRDTVPVNVDAIVFWMVWSAEKSILEVQDFSQAINMSAQTALRESIGRHDLHQMVSEREMLGTELQRILDAKTAMGHHRAIGGDSRCADPDGTAGCHVAAGSGGARASGAEYPGAGGDRDRG